jgi:hypothetical protein
MPLSTGEWGQNCSWATPLISGTRSGQPFLFFSHNLSIMGVYVCVTYYVLKWIDSVKARHKAF